MDWTALALSLRLAAITTVILLALGLPLAWWLATTRLRARPIVDAVVAAGPDAILLGPARLRRAVVSRLQRAAG